METASDKAAGTTGYGNPPWRFKGRALYQLHLVKSQVARALIPKEFKLVEAFGYTLGGFFLANYDDSPAGVFDELVVIAGLVWNPPTSCAWASKVLVNSNEACLHGQRNVGLPSNVARFTKLRCCPEQTVAECTKQQENRHRFLSMIGFNPTKSSLKFDLQTEVTEIRGREPSSEIFSINILSSVPREDSKAWPGPFIKMSLPSFSGRTVHNPKLLKYSCQMECRVRIVQPVQISEASPTNNLTTDQHAAEDQNLSSVHQSVEEKRSRVCLSVMLSKPILALEFSCLNMNVEAPLIISE